MRTMTLTFLMLACTSTATAQQIGLQFLDKLSAIANETSRVDMDESMLKSLGVLTGGDGVSKKGLEGLRALHLRTYDFENSLNRIDELRFLRNEFGKLAWVALLQGGSGEGKNEIWIHRSSGAVDGLLLISAMDNKLRVISVDGLTRPEELTKLALGMPATGSK